MAPIIMVLTILFGGFYINAGSMPVWIGWLENVSTIKWCFEAYCINEFTGLEFCDAVEDGPDDYLEYDHLYGIEQRKEQTKLNLNHDRTPVSISWDQITYSVRIKDPAATRKCCAPKTDKLILSD